MGRRTVRVKGWDVDQLASCVMLMRWRCKPLPRVIPPLRDVLARRWRWVRVGLFQRRVFEEIHHG
jgi:hypothetical protein